MIKDLQEKYTTALKLRNAISTIKDATAVKESAKAELLEYIQRTGDSVFRWKSGLSLTYVSGKPAGKKVNAQKFMELAKKHMTADAYTACIAEATEDTKATEGYFR